MQVCCMLLCHQAMNCAMWAETWRMLRERKRSQKENWHSWSCICRSSEHERGSTHCSLGSINWTDRRQGADWTLSNKTFLKKLSLCPWHSFCAITVFHLSAQFVCHSFTFREKMLCCKDALFSLSYSRSPCMSMIIPAGGRNRQQDENYCVLGSRCATRWLGE